MSPSTASPELTTTRPRASAAKNQIAALSPGPGRPIAGWNLYEARFDALARAIVDGVWTADAQGKIVTDIPGWSAFTGQNLEQMRGEGWNAALHPDDRRRVLETWTQAVREGAPRYETEYRLRRRDGEYRDVWARGVPVSDPGGMVREWLGVWADITERKREEEELRNYRVAIDQLVAQRTANLAAMTEKLAATVEELETFAYSVSHDLRAPLRAIDAFSRILLDDYADKLDGEARRLLKVVRDSTVMMSRLIDDILNLSRVGRLEMTPRPVDMGKLVGSVLASELGSATTGRELAIDIGALPEAHCDPVLLRHVWLNLLDNAIKFTAPKPHARIEIGGTSGEGEAVYFVRDTGVGFDMRYVDKLFGTFQRLHGSEFAGTGIGLAIVRRIVRRHGGRVWAESKVGEGATFYFALPTCIGCSSTSLRPSTDFTDASGDTDARRRYLVAAGA